MASSSVTISHTENKLLSRPMVEENTTPEFNKSEIKELEIGLFNIFKSKYSFLFQSNLSHSLQLSKYQRKHPFNVRKTTQKYTSIQHRKILQTALRFQHKIT
jgi:hypothetical protein